MEQEKKQLTPEESDQAVLAIIKESRETLLNFWASRSGLACWYKEFRDSNRILEYTSHDIFIAGKTFSGLEYMLTRLDEETDFFNSMVPDAQ
jgi:hypothetical protein